MIDATIPCTKQLLEVFDRFQAPVIALMEVPTNQSLLYGIVTADPVLGSGLDGLYRITDLVEKPLRDQAPSNLAVIGQYVRAPHVFELLSQASPGHGSEIRLTDALKMMAKQRELFGLRFTGQRYDTGDKLRFLIANIELALSREGLGEKLFEYLRHRLFD